MTGKKMAMWVTEKTHGTGCAQRTRLTEPTVSTTSDTIQIVFITLHARMTSGESHRSLATRSWAYCSEKDLPAAMDIRIMIRSEAFWMVNIHQCSHCALMKMISTHKRKKNMKLPISKIFEHRLQKLRILTIRQSAKLIHAPVGTDQRLIMVQKTIHGKKPSQRFMRGNYERTREESRNRIVSPSPPGEKLR